MQHRDALPTTLSALVAYDAEYRKAIFDALTPEQKASIWQGRFAQDLAEPLTPSQRALVWEAMTYASPERYRDHARFPESWRAAVNAQFSPGQAFHLFESLGPEEDGVFRLPTCACNDDTDCHSPSKPYCHQASCNISASGCGPGGADQCTVGICRSTP
jgi:hypothetical protein